MMMVYVFIPAPAFYQRRSNVASANSLSVALPERVPFGASEGKVGTKSDHLMCRAAGGASRGFDGKVVTSGDLFAEPWSETKARIAGCRSLHVQIYVTISICNKS